ncbi:unnamed protein product [Caenorhabditis auriculariae]|uniref:Uncharacterized protein n=1 Tax=Caenorhabditis auriculariae TaxID=2777116 RepID=A0A8S1HYR6_9PELO|nr:unnamed protein product [Caenorhabditis auriculariae]
MRRRQQMMKKRDRVKLPTLASLARIGESFRLFAHNSFKRASQEREVAHFRVVPGFSTLKLRSLLLKARDVSGPTHPHFPTMIWCHKEASQTSQRTSARVCIYNTSVDRPPTNNGSLGRVLSSPPCRSQLKTRPKKKKKVADLLATRESLGLLVVTRVSSKPTEGVLCQNAKLSADLRPEENVLHVAELDFTKEHLPQTDGGPTRNEKIMMQSAPPSWTQPIRLRPILLPSPPVRKGMGVSKSLKAKHKRGAEPSKPAQIVLPSISTLFQPSPSLSTTSTGSTSSYCQFSPESGTFSPYNPYSPGDYGDYMFQYPTEMPPPSSTASAATNTQSDDSKDVTQPLFVQTDDDSCGQRVSGYTVKPDDLLLRPAPLWRR